MAGSRYQVSWNPLHEFTLASAHDGEVRIWDMRTGSSDRSCRWFEAHAKDVIKGLEWQPRTDGSRRSRLSPGLDILW